MSVRSPILFFVFHRPDATARVFEAIRTARPPGRYIAVDGPRTIRPLQAERDAVRRVATAVDWPCEVFPLFRAENVGCRRTVSSGISWFFEQEPKRIVIEEACGPNPSFFPHCDESLERNRDDPRMMCISGDNFIASTWALEESYYFGRHVHIWGWATWRRAWASYDVDMHDWRDGRDTAVVDTRLPSEPRAAAHWRRLFDEVANGRMDTWDYQWPHACWRKG